MSITLGALTVTVVNRTTTTADRYGNPGFITSGTFDLTGCHLQQRVSDEELIDAGTTITRWLLFAPPLGAGQTLTTRDLIRIDAATAYIEPDPGQTYATFQLDGDPDVLPDFDGTAHHLELTLRRIKL